VKALSLWQPWAQLLALGAKRTETRSWGTRYRGPLLVHAGLRNALEDRLSADMLKPHRAALWRRGCAMGDLPRGAVVGVCIVDDVRRVCTGREPWLLELSHEERLFGDHGVGRFVWFVSGASPFARPWPARGRQGLFDLEIPEGHHGTAV
jgi:hypothetical protein